MDIPGGIYWPFERRIFAHGSAVTIDATGEYVACVGQVYIEDRSSSSKTLDTSGSSAIRFMPNARTWATAGSTVQVGLKDIDKTTGPVRPGSTWHVSRTLTQGVDTITAGTAQVCVPDSGSLTLTHGDEVCIVAEFTNRAGSDSLALTTAQGAAGATFLGAPFGINNISGVVSGTTPFFVLTFSDGTTGWIDGLVSPAGTITNVAYTATTNPDERGNCFQVPFDCEVDLFWAMLRTASTASDGTIILYSDPLGTPTALATWTFTAEELGTFGSGILANRAFPPVALAANTDYVVAMQASSSGSIRMDGLTLFTGSGVCRQMWPAGETVKFAYRQDGSGAFTMDDTQVMSCGVRISAITTTGGSGGMIGGGNLRGGFQ